MNESTQTPISATERLNKIVNDGMCIGCGLCEPVAGADKVKVKKSAAGMLIPFASDNLDHETVDKIYDVCPGTRVEGLPEHLVDENTQHDLVWGDYRKMVLGWASDEETRFKASTGGALTALGQYLLTSNKVDFLLHARASKANPTFGEACLSLEVDDVINAAGSRYGPTAALINIDEVLNKNQPFAYIGLPCDIAALRNYAKLDNRVNKLVKYWLTPVCGGYMPTPSMRDFLNKLNIDFDQLSGFRYRGYGCPGPTRIELKDGTVIEKNYTDFWGEDESCWSLPHRCKMCPDGIGEAADIAASDTWPSGSPDPASEHLDPGTNAIVVRTAQGLALLNDAVDAGFITLGELVDPRYMNSVQPHQMNKKLKTRARYNGQRAAGSVVPRTARLRLDALYEANNPVDNQAQFEGAMKRAVERKSRFKNE